MSVVRSLAFYAAFYLGSVVLTIASLAMLPFGTAPYRRMVRRWSRYQRWCARHLLGIRIRMIGAPAREPVLYALKHESFFEAIDLPRLLPLPAVFTKAELFDIPLWGRAALAYGLVPVARGDGAKALRAMLSAARREVATGRSLAIFPEGTRVPHGSSPPLQAGFAGLYKLIGLPVVPVALDSGPLYHRRWKRGGTLTYRFGETIPAGLPRDEIEARVHAAINALNR